MATYKEIFGTNIEVLASDPANPVEGQVWYNSTDNVVKGAAATTAGAWATASPLNTNRAGGMGSVQGTQTATLIASGYQAPAVTANVELYNGSAWTETANVNTARYGGYSSGTQTSTLIFAGNNAAGGSPTPSGDQAIAESWNGSAWTEVADLSVSRRFPGGTGASNTNALCFGGFDETVYVTLNESFNGTSWTEVGDLNSIKAAVAGNGATNTAALCIGGNTPGGVTAETESWNGTSWTEVGDLNTARRDLGNAGTQTSAIVMGGLSGTTWYAITEEWNGSSWTETSDMNVAREIYAGGAGSSASAVAAQGVNAPGVPLTNTEEWTGAGAPLVYTFTDS